MHSADIIVIGAGIAGVSAAAELAANAQVVMVDMEQQPGYHATGRSAAYYATSYGKPLVQAVTRSCESFFLRPPDGFTESELLRPRDCMFFARPDQIDSLEAMRATNPRLEFLDEAAVRARVPVFKSGYLAGALHDPRGGDLDVDALLQGYLRLFRRRGGLLFNNHEVSVIKRAADTWQVTAGEQLFSAPVVVNAAGGWADCMARLAGLEALGVEPYRRTAMTIDAPGGFAIANWPEMVDIDEEFYFKPDAGLILLSPADETLTRPVDAQPDEWDVATGVYRFEQATGLDIRQIRASWAGLRTFASDRLFVTGFDPRVEGFFWLAGQGGYGVQSAPAMAKMAAYLIAGTEPGGDFGIVRDHIQAVSPARLL